MLVQARCEALLSLLSDVGVNMIKKNWKLLYLWSYLCQIHNALNKKTRIFLIWRANKHFNEYIQTVLTIVALVDPRGGASVAPSFIFKFLWTNPGSATG